MSGAYAGPGGGGSQNYFSGFNQAPTGRSPWMYGYEQQPFHHPNLTDPDIYSLRTRYDYANPGFAMDNTLRDVGMNPYAANPYTQSLRASAPAMAMAYEASRALAPQQTQVNTGDDFRDFLRGAVFPGQYAPTRGQSSPNLPATQDTGFYANINRGIQALPELVQRMRGLDPGNVGGQTAAQVNPYLYDLQQQFNANSGRGILDYMAAMQAPLMNQQMRQSYGNLLNAAYGGAMNQYAQSGQGLGQGDIWSYFLGY